MNTQQQAERLAHTYADAILRLSYAYLKNTQDAQDICQLKSPWRKRTCDLEACAQVPAPEAEDGSVLAAVNGLPPHYRAVIYLFYYEGYQAAEIGQILGVPTATVHTRLARGRTKLRTVLEGDGYEQSV